MAHIGLNYKGTSTFQGPKPNSRSFSRRLVKFKTFSRLYEPCEMVYKRVRGWTLRRNLPV